MTRLYCDMSATHDTCCHAAPPRRTALLVATALWKAPTTSSARPVHTAPSSPRPQHHAQSTRTARARQRHLHHALRASSAWVITLTSKAITRPSHARRERYAGKVYGASVSHCAAWSVSLLHCLRLRFGAATRSHHAQCGADVMMCGYMYACACVTQGVVLRIPYVLGSCDGSG